MNPADSLRDYAGETYPELDSQIALSFRPTKRDARYGIATDPFNCSMARCVQRSFDYPAAVFRQVTLILMPVDKATLRWNRKYNHRGEGLKVGDLVWMRFRNPSSLTREVTHLDDGEAFEPQPMTLRRITVGDRITREKYSETRRSRADARLEGKEPSYKRKKKHLDLRRASF